MSIRRIIRKIPLLFEIWLKVTERIDLIKTKKLKKMDDHERRLYLSSMYKEKVGKELDWNNLHTYTEIMQWVKLYDVTELKAMLADKYAVRAWVEEKIGNQYLIPLLGVWDKFDDIDFSKLPNRFVLKVTNGSGTNIIVSNKKELNLRLTKAKIHKWMAVDYSYLKGFELHYSMIKPRIIAEKFIEHDGEDLPDYKFICFNGKVYYCWVDVGRYHNHKRNIYDLNWNLQPWNQYNYGNADYEIKKPICFDKMVELATVLCQGFSHVRVDFYEMNGKIYFGEMTFTNGSGFEAIFPEKCNRMLGDLWNLQLQ